MSYICRQKKGGTYLRLIAGLNIQDVHFKWYIIVISKTTRNTKLVKYTNNFYQWTKKKLTRDS